MVCFQLRICAVRDHLLLGFVQFVSLPGLLLWRKEFREFLTMVEIRAEMDARTIGLVNRHKPTFGIDAFEKC